MWTCHVCHLVGSLQTLLLCCLHPLTSTRVSHTTCILRPDCYPSEINFTSPSIHLLISAPPLELLALSELEGNGFSLLLTATFILNSRQLVCKLSQLSINVKDFLLFSTPHSRIKGWMLCPSFVLFTAFIENSS